MVWIDQEFILLCCTEDTAKDLARQLDKPIDDKLDAMAYRPGDASKQPWKLDIGSHLLKSIHIEDYCNQDFISVSGKGLSSDDVVILEDTGFSYRFADGEELYENRWSKPKEYSDDEKVEELVNSLNFIANYLDSEERDNYDSWLKEEINKAKRMAEELPDLFVENGHLLSPAIRTGVPEIVDLFMAQKPSRDTLIHIGNIAWSDDDQPLGKFIFENGFYDRSQKIPLCFRS